MNSFHTSVLLSSSPTARPSNRAWVERARTSRGEEVNQENLMCKKFLLVKKSLREEGVSVELETSGSGDSAVDRIVVSDWESSAPLFIDP